MYKLNLYGDIPFSTPLKEWAKEFYRNNGGKIIPSSAITSKESNLLKLQKKLLVIDWRLLKKEGFIIDDEIMPKDVIKISHYEEVATDNNKNLLLDFS